jgi:putative transcriptional regulator
VFAGQPGKIQIMADAAQPINLTNHFLIAMPGMVDGTFARSVVYVCEHNEHGALGLIINKPGEINLADLFQKVDLPLQRKELSGQPVFHGGPLQTERGFVLHDPVVAEGLEPDQTIYASTLAVPGGLEMTTSKDVLEALSSGGGPRRVLVTLGYSSWGGGQLESEIARNSWLTVDANADLVFDAPVAERYDLALRLLGLEAWTLAPGAGHA